jgi:hypothetical protein
MRDMRAPTRLRLLAVLGSGVAAAAVGQPAERPLAETCPKLTPAEIAGIENYKGQFAENALYARAYCVSVQEAERRMAIQLRDAVGPKTEPGRPPAPPPDSIGEINAALQQKEATTFAGLWIQHRPEYRVVVAFTRNAARRWRNTPGTRSSSRSTGPGPTYAELRAMQDRLVKELTERGFRWSGAGAQEDKGSSRSPWRRMPRRSGRPPRGATSRCRPG